jgi:hypothetical protein
MRRASEGGPKGWLRARTHATGVAFFPDLRTVRIGAPIGLHVLRHKFGVKGKPTYLSTHPPRPPAAKPTYLPTHVAGGQKNLPTYLQSRKWNPHSVRRLPGVRKRNFINSFVYVRLRLFTILAHTGAVHERPELTKIRTVRLRSFTGSV